MATFSWFIKSSELGWLHYAMEAQIGARYTDLELGEFEIRFAAPGFDDLGIVLRRADVEALRELVQRKQANRRRHVAGELANVWRFPGRGSEAGTALVSVYAGHKAGGFELKLRSRLDRSWVCEIDDADFVKVCNDFGIGRQEA